MMKKAILALLMVVGSSTAFAKSMTLKECVDSLSADAVNHVRGGTGYTGDISVVKVDVQDVENYRLSGSIVSHEIYVWVQGWGNSIHRSIYAVNKECRSLQVRTTYEDPEWRQQNLK